MSNSIWKTPDQKPKQEELVAWEDINGIHAGRFDTCYNCFCACADYRADLRKAKKWCSLENLADIIAQADKAERLQKAVEYVYKLLLEETNFTAGVHLPNKYQQKIFETIKQLIKE